jgi:hemerythrin-like metal-binding protein
MSVIPWSNMFSVGVKEIDSQHQVLINIIDRLSDALETQSKTVDTAKVIEEIVQYAVYHFGSEERLLQQYSCSGAAKHIAEHQTCLKQVQQMVRQIERGQGPSPEELVIFLRDWIVSHILSCDREMGDALNAAGIR